jgi:asparagine synthase (glutamine-hydrolysing)
MCGIVGVLRFDGKAVDEQKLRVMRDTMFHRGPDDGGLYVNGPAGLGHRRLAIVDLSDAGHQPMANEDGTVWLVFNGEIYNYVELRAELIARGHKFSSHTDTEVILHLYEEEGERCVSRLRGMFAFVLWDARRQLMFGARDRVGIKPFNYYVDAKQFICASESKALLADGDVPRRVDHEGLAGYFFAGFPQGDRTMFSGIRQLPPGHSITVSGGAIRVHRYWDLQYTYNFARSDAQALEELEAMLDESARLHCRSDAELGCHLSGGLDSSAVTGLAARHRPSMKTFSIRFNEGGEWYDETAYAREMAAAAGAEYHEAVPSGDDLASVFPGLVWHMEMPLPNLGGFAYYTVSRLAAEHVKVTLTGHGGDEIFAGYKAQFESAFGSAPFFDSSLEPVPPTRPLARAASMGRRLAQLGIGGAARRVGRRIRPAPLTAEEKWVALHCSRPPQQNSLLSPHFVSRLDGYSPVDDYLTAFRQAPTTEALDRCLYHDLACYLPGLLYMEDRVSMAMSVESRVPLLDHRLVEFMATVPAAQKVPGLQPKAMLRAAARTAAVPDAICNRRDKRGFPVPFRFWILDVLKDMSHDVLLAPQSLDRGIIDADRLRQWRLTPHETQLALSLELWFRIFIDEDPEWTDRASTATGAFIGAGA